MMVLRGQPSVKGDEYKCLPLIGAEQYSLGGQLGMGSFILRNITKKFLILDMAGCLELLAAGSARRQRTAHGRHHTTSK